MNNIPTAYTVLKQHAFLCGGASAFDSEMAAAAHALHIAATDAHNLIDEIHLFVDNKSVVQQLLYTRGTSAQRLAIRSRWRLPSSNELWVMLKSNW